MMLGWVEPPASSVAEVATVAPVAGVGFVFDGFLGAADAEAAAVAQTEKNLSTSEKILIVSLFLNVAALAWSVYQFQESR